MATAGENAVNEIQRDLACPECQYNLRGLRGKIVSCPECGVRCDVAKLIAARWEKPWYTAPMFNQLAVPVLWAFVGFMITTVALGVVQDHMDSPGVLAFLGAWVLALAGGWAILVYYIGRRRFGSWQGVWLSLLAHFLVAGYAVGVVGIFLSIFAVLAAVSDLSSTWVPFSSTLVTLVTRLLILLALVVLVYVCRRAERYMAGQCIRRYLALQTTAPAQG